MKRASFFLIIAVPLSLGGCSDADEARRDAASDARDIALVERLNTVPPFAVVPQPITSADVETHGMSGAGCYFLNGAGEGADMLFVASDARGWLKLDGKILSLSSDRSSSELPYVSWSKYVGLANTVQLDLGSAAARSTGLETEAAPGRMIVRDSADREVFSASGTIECGA